jgi:dimethylhistidine N-methyltransferase
MLTATITATPLETFAADVRQGLSSPGQKELPCKYFYDAIGSALFEVISLLPEYGLTRAGERLMRRHAEELAAQLPAPLLVAELGSGSGRNTRWLLEAISRRQPINYFPIELSPAALASCQRELGAIPAVNVLGFEQPYLEGLAAAVGRRREPDTVLALFLGSTIGNFDRPAGERFLRQVRDMLRPGDLLLLAADLVKPAPALLAAYDDPLGVTAAFNLNLLARINRELGAAFDLDQFEHVAIYNERERRIEMHLRARRDMTVSIPRAGCTVTLARGETIWTENSHKYTPKEIVDTGDRAGFHCTVQWLDQEWPFAHTLFQAA